MSDITLFYLLASVYRHIFKHDFQGIINHFFQGNEEYSNPSLIFHSVKWQKKLYSFNAP
jgi:hypothetical protein